MLAAHEAIPRKERVIVALDCDRKTALDLAKRLQGRTAWLKVGMTLYYAEGPAIIEIFKLLGFKVFLDLKFHDIPHQVAGAAASAVAAGADMVSVHAAGGVAMMQAAHQAATSGPNPAATLAITVLTSMDDEALKGIGVSVGMAEQVRHLALSAQKAGLSGVVASPHEAAMLRELLGPQALIVTPGVRPQGAARGDQSRIATPRQAFDEGASHIVVGRPITQAADPAAALDEIIETL